MSGRKTRIALAEDDVLLREGIASLLRHEGFEIVAQAGDAEELMTAVVASRPDVALVDIRMPPTHTTEGLQVARTIRETFPETGVLLLSAYAEVEHAMELLSAGSRVGYLLKSRVASVADFIEAIDRISGGGSVIDPALVRELFATRHREDPLERLTAREHEVLALMAEGRSNAGIAHRLWITEGTVEKHVRAILTKMRLPDTGDDHRRVLAVVAFLGSR
ncbi:response regulator transcription factor [Streptosporangium sp. NPDC048047]|uniref:response regulator transcription factor n=1 Tax=Streptosporangium sp. NPDC048047 TaxID=3155748 RepID=UPI00343E60D5